MSTEETSQEDDMDVESQSLDAFNIETKPRSVIEGTTNVLYLFLQRTLNKDWNVLVMRQISQNFTALATILRHNWFHPFLSLIFCCCLLCKTFILRKCPKNCTSVKE